MKKTVQSIGFLIKKFTELVSVNKWFNKHPKIYHQLSERLSLDKFTGIALTILTIVFLYAVLLFFGVIQDYLSQDSLILTDARIANLLYAFQNNNFIHIFYFITLFAEPTIIIILSAVLSISI